MLGLLALQARAASGDASRGEVVAGDIATGILPLWAFGMAWLGEEESEGMKQWCRDTGLALVAVTTVRFAFNQTGMGERPNGNRYSFPSGHAGFVFSQAGFLQERYGWKYGVPALVTAGAVSYIRVRNDKHYWRDIWAGAILGYGAAWLTVTPYQATHLAPIVGPDWLGIRFERSF
jgi:membrane-associated phospholipid phosphatase